MRIAYVTPEVWPFSKTGGLADVAQALPEALTRLGVEATVFSPYYRSTAAWFEANSEVPAERELPHGLWIGTEYYPLLVREAVEGGIRHVLICNGHFFDRAHCYLDGDGNDYPDNVARFSFFCQGVLHYLRTMNAPPDIIHANDWQAGLLPAYLKTTYAGDASSQARCLFTIHNLGYQGLFPADHIFATGLGWEHFHPDGLEFYGQLNLLKAGIVFCDQLSTVSPTYAQEIQQPEQGRGLDGVIRAAGAKLVGILNGIDLQTWNPATDPHLPDHFTPDALSGKLICKKQLQASFGLPLRPKTLVLGMITRLDTQKGVELVLEAFPKVAGLDLQLIMLGAGQPELEARLRALAADYPDQVSVRLGHDEPLAHLIEAGADAFLMASLYEPCGLNQMYSQRYGTLPLVRETGGLKDTVLNATPKRLEAGTASGFAFRPFTAKALADTVRRAAAMYYTNRRAWSKLVKHVMRLDHSWELSARAYLDLYQRMRDAAGLSEGAAA